MPYIIKKTKCLMMCNSLKNNNSRNMNLHIYCIRYVRNLHFEIPIIIKFFNFMLN